MNTIEIVNHAKNCANNGGTLHDNPYDWSTETEKFMQWKEAYCEVKRAKK